MLRFNALGSVTPVKVAATMSQCSTAVASYSSTGTKVAEYLGTFDWYIPKNASGLGNTLYQPEPSAFPYTTGHFREYKASGTFTANSSTDYKNCSSSNTLSASWIL